MNDDLLEVQALQDGLTLRFIALLDELTRRRKAEFDALANALSKALTGAVRMDKAR